VSEYQILGAAGAVLSVIGLVAIAVGAFLEHDGYPSHTTVGKVAEVLGWAGWLAVSVVNSRVTAGLGVDCNVFGRRCGELSDTSGYLWNYIVGPIVLDCVWGGCAHALGWAAAKVTRRSGRA
jgi:hypothetical protein